MITRSETIDHQHSNAKQQFKRFMDKWRRDCTREAVGEKIFRKGGRTLKRAIERKQCKVETDEDGNTLTSTYTMKGRPIGRATVTLLNTPLDEEPELTEA